MPLLPSLLSPTFFPFLILYILSSLISPCSYTRRIWFRISPYPCKGTLCFSRE
jgi:hypothetical protein